MNPPTKSAIAHAIRALMESVQEENGTQTSPGILISEVGLDCLHDVSRALISVRSTILEDLDHQIAAAHKRINHRHPLLSLPPELTLDILQLALDGGVEDDISLIPQLRSLAGVSVGWWRLIVSAPELWRKIDMGDGYAAASLAIRNSGNQTLDVRFDGSHGHPDGHHELMEAIRGESHRWRSVVVHGWYFISTFLPFLQRPTPCLEIVELKGLERVRDDSHIDPVNWTASPSLRSLILINLERSPTRLIFHTNPNGPVAWPSSSKIIMLLLSCPGLEILSLEGVMHEADVLPKTTVPYIPLSKLRTLRIKRCSRRWTAFLLHCLTAPSVTTLEVDCIVMLAVNAINVLREVMEPRGEVESLAEIVFRNTTPSSVVVTACTPEPHGYMVKLQISSFHITSPTLFKITLSSPSLTSHFTPSQWQATFATVSVPTTVVLETYTGSLHFIPFVPTFTRLEIYDEDLTQLQRAINFMFCPAAEPQHTYPSLSEITYRIPHNNRSWNQKIGKYLEKTFADPPPPGCVHPKVLLYKMSGEIFDPMDY